MRLVDHEAVLAEFESFLLADGRRSHGTDFLLRRLAELRAQHRVVESQDQAVLRRFGAHLQDVFLGLLPEPSATGDPLAPGDREAPAAMDDGAGIPSQPEREVPCPKTLKPPSAPSRPSRREPDSKLAVVQIAGRHAAATSS